MSSNNKARISIPYLFHLNTKEKKAFAINRKYKPLGSSQQEWANYVMDSHVQIYLFDDSCPPWRSTEDREKYLKRVQELLDNDFKEYQLIPSGEKDKIVPLNGDSSLIIPNISKFI